VTGELGRGGQGVVYRARHRELRSDFAIKTVLDAPPGSPAARRLEREAAVLGRLRHAGIVDVYAVIEEARRLYVVMALVEGESLEARLGRAGPLPAREVAALGVALARALTAAHAEGVLHRDLKPSNVLLRRHDGAALLTDFGLAKARDLASSVSLSQRGRILGTPGFTPPEQAFGELDRIGPTSDVYGLGATLFAAAVGRAPHEGESLVELLAGLQRPVEVPAAVEPGLAAVLSRALAPRPEDRYPSIADMGIALEACLEPAAGPPRRPRPSAATAIAVALAAAGGLALGLALARGEAPDARAAPDPSTSTRPSPSPPAPDPTPALEDALERAERLAEAGDVVGWRDAVAEAERLAGGARAGEVRAARRVQREALAGAVADRLREPVAFRPALLAAHRDLDAEFADVPSRAASRQLERASYLFRRFRLSEAAALAGPLEDLPGRRGLEAQRLRASALYFDGRAAEAATAFRAIVERAPGSPEASVVEALSDYVHVQMALAPGGEAARAASRRRIEEAVARLGRAVDDAPDYTPALSLRALLLTRLGRAREVGRDAARAVELAPDDPHARYAAGWVATGEGSPERAADHLLAALRISGGHYPTAVPVLTQILPELRRSRELLELFGEAAAGSDRRALLARLGRATIRLQLGERDSARAELRPDRRERPDALAREVELLPSPSRRLLAGLLSTPGDPRGGQ